jgi:hypothetical protein
MRNAGPVIHIVSRLADLGEREKIQGEKLDHDCRMATAEVVNEGLRLCNEAVGQNYHRWLRDGDLLDKTIAKASRRRASDKDSLPSNFGLEMGHKLTGFRISIPGWCNDENL